MTSVTHEDLTRLSSNTIKQLSVNKLPSISEVLRLLFHKTKQENMKLTDAIKSVITEVLFLWNKALVTTVRFDHCRENLAKLYSEYRKYQKYSTMNEKKLHKSTS